MDTTGTCTASNRGNSDVLTLAKLQEAAARLRDGYVPLPASVYEQLDRAAARFFGMDVVEAFSYPEPVIKKLHEALQVSDAFRKQFDLWLLEYFGTRDRCPVSPGMAYILSGRTLVVLHPFDAMKIKSIY